MEGEDKMENTKYTRLTLGERMEIERGLNSGQSLRQTAAAIGRGTSTVSREVLRNSAFCQTGGFGSPFNDCALRKDCGQSRICAKEGCRKALCRGCPLCAHVCGLYRKESCQKLKKPPYVCNGCQRRRQCTLEKAVYKAKAADRSAGALLRTARQGVCLDEGERARLDGIVSPLIAQGQSPWQICDGNKDALMISDKTLYKYIDAGLLSAKNAGLRRKVKMKPRRPKPQPKIEKACRGGRTYRDFLEYIGGDPDIEAVQMDTVIGAKGRGEKCLTTQCFPKSELLIARLREDNTARSAQESLDREESILGAVLFARLFGLFLTDNGPEFSAPSKIEALGNGGCRVFYCDPHCAYQKGAVENSHRLLRYFLPKGASMNGLTQGDIDLMLSHINSYPRKSLGGQTPIEAFEAAYGAGVLEMIGIVAIPVENVTLGPSIFKK
jgi:IS30 family transposase